MALIQSIRDMGITIIMVEHLVKAVFGMADRIVVLNAGDLIAEGTPARDLLQRGSHRRLPREVSPWLTSSQIRGVDVAYGDIQALVGCVAGGRRGRDRRADRAERGREDDPDAGHRRAPPAASPAPSIWVTRPCTPRRPTGSSTHGVILVPEGRRLFGGLTVIDNLELGAYSKRAREVRASTLKLVFELFPLLAERKAQRANTMSGGQQQMLAIGRALMGVPKLLMLDEPSLGLGPLVVENIFETMQAHERAGRDHLPGGTERPAGARTRRPCLHPRAGTDRRYGSRCRNSCTTTGYRKPIWASARPRRD